MPKMRASGRARTAGRNSFADIDIEHVPYPVAMLGIAAIDLLRAALDEPDRSLLSDPERNAVGRERENTIGAVDIVRRKPAGEAVERCERDLQLRRFEISEQRAQHRSGKTRVLHEIIRLAGDRRLRQRKQHGAVKFKRTLERRLLLREQNVAVGIDRAAIGLADQAAHGQEYDVARRIGLATVERWRPA